MARPHMTFRPSDLEDDAPPPYAATAPEGDATVPPEQQQQQQQTYPALNTSYIVQQNQQQQLQQPITPPPPIHYYPVLTSAPVSTPATAPAPYPQYPVMNGPVGSVGGGNQYSAYLVSSQSQQPHAYPVMSVHAQSSGVAAGPRLTGVPPPAASGGGGGGAYPLPYPSVTGIPPTHTTHYPHHYPAHATQHHHQQQQQQQPAAIPSTPNVAVTEPTVLPTAPEENLIDLDDAAGRWDQSEPPRGPHAYTSTVLAAAIPVLSPTQVPAPAAAPHTGVAASPPLPAHYVPPLSPPQQQQVLPAPVQQVRPPLAALPDLVTLYKCRKCGATLDSDTAVCKRIHVPGGFSGEHQVNQATEADLSERRRMFPTSSSLSNGAANGSYSSVGSSSLGSGSTETVYDSSHGISEVYLNHRQYTRARKSEESVPQIISPPPPPHTLASSSTNLSTLAPLGRATSMVNHSSSNTGYDNNHGTNDVYIRRSFSTQNPVSSLKKLWRDTMTEVKSVQAPSYSTRHHELVAPPPLPPMHYQQQHQPQQYHHHQQQQSYQSPHAVLPGQHYPGYYVPMTMTTASSRNPFDDPPTPAYNPQHVPAYIPELPMQQHHQPLPAPSAPPSHPW